MPVEGCVWFEREGIESIAGVELGVMGLIQKGYFVSRFTKITWNNGEFNWSWKFGSSDNTEILEILTIDSHGVLITEKW